MQIQLLAGHQRPARKNAIKMAFRWRTEDGPSLNAGLVACDFKGIWTSIAKEPCIL